MTRRPPKPKTWNSPKGSCRMCGEPIIENDKQNMRKNWHKECVGLWFVMSDPAYARRFIWDREKGFCQGCGKDLHDHTRDVKNGLGLVIWQFHESWQVDHHKPLFEAEGDLSFWHPDNLKLLCSDCHAGKTSSEATRRALKKRKKGIDDD